MRILITSAGGPAAVGVIKSIRDLQDSHYIVATDMNEMSVGFHKANKGYIVPPADDKDFLPKIKIELIVDDGIASQVIEEIVKSSKTGKIGDGKIFVTEISQVIRIRTGEEGSDAL